jgi:hypothetical protein
MDPAPKYHTPEASAQVAPICRPGTYRPPELRRRHGDPLEQKITALQYEMAFLSSDWETRGRLWREILARLAKRPAALVEQLERERLQRVLGGDRTYRARIR